MLKVACHPHHPLLQVWAPCPLRLLELWPRLPVRPHLHQVWVELYHRHPRLLQELCWQEECFPRLRLPLAWVRPQVAQCLTQDRSSYRQHL